MAMRANMHYTLSPKTIQRLAKMKKKTGHPASRLIDYAVEEMEKKSVIKIAV